MTQPEISPLTHINISLEEVSPKNLKAWPKQKIIEFLGQIETDFIDRPDGIFIIKDSYGSLATTITQKFLGEVQLREMPFSNLEKPNSLL